MIPYYHLDRSFFNKLNRTQNSKQKSKLNSIFNTHKIG